jgi:hypothetical protein
MLARKFHGPQRSAQDRVTSFEWREWLLQTSDRWRSQLLRDEGQDLFIRSRTARLRDSSALPGRRTPDCRSAAHAPSIGDGESDPPLRARGPSSLGRRDSGSPVRSTYYAPPALVVWVRSRILLVDKMREAGW